MKCHAHVQVNCTEC